MQVHTACQELLDEMDKQGRPSVTLEDVADRLYAKGIRNPRTKLRPSRQQVLNILTAPGNRVGLDLHERILATTTVAGRIKALT